MSGAPNILEARSIHKSFGQGAGRVHVLQGLDLDVRRGEFLAVVGPSGCGKTTLLHVLGLITPPDPANGTTAGELRLDGQPVPRRESRLSAIRRRRIGFIFQRFNLLPMLTAEDNIEISLKVRGLRRDGRWRGLFDRLGIAHVARRKPADMSIGEQQRVAVARALAHGPDVLLADEPTGSLDTHSAAELLDLLAEINRRDGQTIVMITHSSDAAARADRIVSIKDGKILEQA